MQKNPLIVALKNLDRKEMTRFCEFAHSPYFNKHQEVRQLVAHLSQIYPVFDEKNCDRKALHKKIYPDQPLQQPKLAVVFTYANRLLEQFFMVEQGKAEGVLDSKTLLNKYQRQHKMPSFFEKNRQVKTGGGKKRSGSYPIGSPLVKTPSTCQVFENLYKTAAERDASQLQHAPPAVDALWEKQHWLNAYFLTEKLRDACELIHRKKMLHVELPSDDVLDKSLEAIREGVKVLFADCPLLIAYYHLYQLLHQNHPQAYAPTLQKIKEVEPHLALEDLQYIYNSLQNFCIGEINRNNPVFLRELFGIYQSQLEKGLLLVDGRLPEWHYKNITTTGLRLDEHQWVRSFLEKYRTMLPEDVAENAFNYNLATYHYHVRNFDEVLLRLVKIEYTDVRYSLDAKSLLLRTYYDLNEEEPLLALCESFKQFLKRNRQLTDFQKKGYYNLLKFTRKAFSMKLNAGFMGSGKWTAALEKLRREMASADNIFNQGWLEGKVGEFVRNEFV